MVTCPSCGKENPDGFQFCGYCTAPLTEAQTSAVQEERKLVSVLFVDLVGFTSRSDRADPEDVRATLRPYHERVKADIERFGGTVEKFIGDAVMAVFGAPVTHEDDAERAVRSALRILESIDELRGSGLDISVRAAVTTGEAVVALGARPERGEGLATGDVVNTAARLQGAAPIGGVAVDETTMRTTRGAISYEQLESVTAKGKAEPIATWRAIAARSRVGQPEAGSETPFIGRDLERTLLLETFLRAERESSLQLVTVVGEPGIGKSRLVTELRIALDDRPEVVTWRHGRCLPYGEGITFWALGEIVKAEAGILESDDREAALVKLRDAVSGLFEDESERAWLDSCVGPLVGASGDGAGASREESFTAWRRFLEALALRRPTVLVIEDLHWADEALLEFLEHVLDWSIPAPLFLLCTARPELFEGQPSWGGGKRNATTISLSPLSTDNVARLLQVLLERTLLPAETQAALLERAGGNPLYAEQFARMLDEHGGVDSVAMPETVQALVAARLDTLRPELKGLLHDAAVAGRIFWNGTLAAIEGREREAVRRDLNELVKREFVRRLRVSSMEGEEEFTFWHAVVRDVAYQQIPRVPRAGKHVAVAEWIADSAADRVGDHAEILVHHYAQALELVRSTAADTGGIERQLVHFLLLAGDRAIHLDAEAAEDHYHRAVELSGADAQTRAWALAKLGYARAARGDQIAAIEAYETAIAMLRRIDERAAAAVMGDLGTSLWNRGDTEGARTVRAEALAILGRNPGPEFVEVSGKAALALAIAGRYQEATTLAEQGMAVAAELGVEAVSSHLMTRATVRGHLGEPDSLEDLRSALEIARRLGLSRATGIAMNNYADALCWFESLPAGLAAWNEVIEFTAARGLDELTMWQRGERLRALFHLGTWDELVGDGEEVLRWDEVHGRGQLGIFPRMYLASVQAHRGALEEAAPLVSALLELVYESRDEQVFVPGVATAALVAFAREEEASAIEHLRELELWTRNTVTRTWSSFCLTWPTRIAIALGAIDIAVSFLGGTTKPFAWDDCGRPGALACVAEARGESAEAAQLYRLAAERWLAFGSVVEQAYALIGAGRCGDAKAALEGEAIFSSLGASPLLAVAA